MLMSTAHVHGGVSDACLGEEVVYLCVYVFVWVFITHFDHIVEFFAVVSAVLVIPDIAHALFDIGGLDTLKPIFSRA
jgi:hypothetical protein